MIAVTGAAGFVGRALCRHLAAQGQPYCAIGRVADAATVGVGEIGPDTDWRVALAGADTVVHLAARVHQMAEGGSALLDRYRHTNRDGTLALARQARALGVQRFVFVSSIKVNGEKTLPGRPFRPGDEPAPADPYAQSKLEAETGLNAVADATGLEVVVVRPPLVYGAGVGANFRALVRLVDRGWPLPFGAVRNKRSLIAVDNLADLLVRCARHPAAPGQVFLCSDEEALSTPELLRAVAAAAGRRIRLLPAPVRALQAFARVAGHGGAMRRLTESLEVDGRNTGDRLGWRPPLTVHAALAGAAAMGWSDPPASHSPPVRIE